jgi:two-component sensor histidine kinase
MTNQRTKAVLEAEILVLKRKLRQSVQQQMTHENLCDNFRSLIHRINTDYQQTLSFIEKKNKDLENLTHKLNESYELEFNSNQQLRNEIRERKQAEAALKESEHRLRRSVEEKEVLLGEIHHRVKNNLQVVSSLLQMSFHRSTDEKVKEALSESCSRIGTMALIHSQLYQTNTFSRIDMKLHTQQLFQNLCILYGHHERITWIIDIREVFLPLTIAIPLALVMNEILSNAFKHAFKGIEQGRIRVAMDHLPEEHIVVEVRDNGNGFPPETDFWKADTLGLKLVRNIIQYQLRGVLSFENMTVDQGGGVQVKITFPIYPKC